MNAQLGVLIFTTPFFDDEGAPIALGYVKTTLAGFSTLAGTYADAALTTPNPNSNTLASTLRLDAGGWPDDPMYFSPLNGGVAGVAYDVYVYDQNQVLVRTFEDVSVPVPTAGGNATAAVVGYGTQPTYTISGGAITPEVNAFLVSPEGGSADNLDNIVVTGIPDGAPLYFANTHGAAAITVRHGVGNIFTLDGQNLVLSTTNQRPTFQRWGANVRQVGPSLSTLSIGNDVADGRLTLTTGNPVVDTTSSATVYYTPYIGNRIDLFDGVATWTRQNFSELSLSVAATSNGLYDVFAYNNAGVVTLTLGTVWTNTTTRALGLTRQDGVLVLASNTTRRYLGTIKVLSNLAYDSVLIRGVWNYYHRVQRTVSVEDTTPTWSYATAAWRQARASAANQVVVVTGVAEDAVDLTCLGIGVTSAAAQNIGAGIGVDVTNSGSGAGLLSQSSSATGVTIATTRYNAASLVGEHVYAWLEYGVISGTVTWYGTSAAFAGGMRAGITGIVRT